MNWGSYWSSFDAFVAMGGYGSMCGVLPGPRRRSRNRDRTATARRRRHAAHAGALTWIGKTMKPRHKKFCRDRSRRRRTRTGGGLVLSASRRTWCSFSRRRRWSPGSAVGRSFRIGGLVETGSVSANPMGSRSVSPLPTPPIACPWNTAAAARPVQGGQGVVAGQAHRIGHVPGSEVLAKHDENYMPPEAAEALKKAQGNQPQQSTSTLAATGKGAGK